MNRAIAFLAGIAIATTSPACLGPVTDSQTFSNGVASVRVDRHEETHSLEPGAYLKFYGKSARTADWAPLFTFRHDDPIRIPRDCVRFVSAQITYAFVGWYYTVTSDG